MILLAYNNYFTQFKTMTGLPSETIHKIRENLVKQF